ncbi:hypothetical protein JCM10207_000363 [Rhodosporidiobolus poonsookiae]
MSTIVACMAQVDNKRNRVTVYGTPVSHSVAPSLFDVIFPSVGLPRHKYTAVDCPPLLVADNAWEKATKQPNFLGSCVTMPLKLQAVDKADELMPAAQALRSVNTTFLRHHADGSVTHVGTNLDTAGVGNSLLTALLSTPTPFLADAPRCFAPGTASALMIGGGGATRAAIWAVNSIGLWPIYLINRDASETAAIVAQFPDLDLRLLETVEQVQQELGGAEKQGIRLAAGTGAIPSIEPQTNTEKNIYKVAKRVFEWPYRPETGKPAKDGFISLPSKPVFLEMAYKPRMTIMRKIAEDRNWQTICGVEVVLLT